MTASPLSALLATLDAWCGERRLIRWWRMERVIVVPAGTTEERVIYEAFVDDYEAEIPPDHIAADSLTAALAALIVQLGPVWMADTLRRLGWDTRDDGSWYLKSERWGAASSDMPLEIAWHFIGSTALGLGTEGNDG